MKGASLDDLINQVAYNSEDAKYDFCGSDQETMAKVLVQNDILDKVFKTYVALSSVEKSAGKSVAS